MAGQKLQTFFGEDIEEAILSLLSAPGAFGNIMLGVARQVRPIDVATFVLVLSGWGWLFFGYTLNDNDDTLLLVLAIAPTIIWLTCGLIGGFFYEVSGIGWRIFAFWEAYLLLLFFVLMGVITLRLAINPKDRKVYRGAPAADPTLTSHR